MSSKRQSKAPVTRVMRPIEDDDRIGIVEDVEQLVGEIAVIDVHMGETAFEAGGQRFHVFGLVAQVDLRALQRGWWQGARWITSPHMRILSSIISI